MLDIACIFQNRVLNPARLRTLGCVKNGEVYTISYTILNRQFQMNISISDVGEVSVHLIDCDSQEEYVLVHTPNASGAFVGTVIQECEEKLRFIAENGFDTAALENEQTKQIFAYADKTYQNCPEYLWKKSPNSAVLRRTDSGKWYAVIMTVAKEKLGLTETETVEVIDLRASPDEIEQFVDGKKYFPGYHMNKKHWYTICLNHSVSTQEIYERIETSYLLAKKLGISKEQS